METWDWPLSKGKWDNAMDWMTPVKHNPDQLHIKDNCHYVSLQPTIMEAQGSNRDELQKAKPYQMVRRKSNPGRNAKGKKTVRRHHTGKMPDSYLTDPKARANCLCGRKRTIMKKIDELYKRTKTECYYHMRTETDQNWKYSTPSLGQMYEDILKSNTDRSTTAVMSQGHSSATVTSADFPSPHRRSVTIAESKHTQTSVSSFRKGDCNRCAECNIEREGQGDKEKGPWVGCDRETCSYWAHFSCLGFKVSKKNLKLMSKIPFHCRKHR